MSGAATYSTDGQWAVQAENYYAIYDGALVEMTPNGAQPGTFWYLSFNTWPSHDVMSAGTTYPLAEGNAAMSISFRYGCETIAGSFRVDEFTAEKVDGSNVDKLSRLTVAFSGRCVSPAAVASGSTGVLRGCVHIGQ